MCQQKIRVEEAVGMALSHDITEIRRDGFKGAAFKKGHVVQEADLCRLQKLGKRHLYILKIEEGYLHEDEAALALAEAFCGPGVFFRDEPREGKVNLLAAHNGLLKVNIDALMEINLLEEVMCASRHTDFPVKAGDIVAGLRAIPLVIHSGIIDQAVSLARSNGSLFQVKPLRKAKVGLVITGSEVFARLIDDQFEPVLRQKIAQIGSETHGVAFAPDDADFIEKLIRQFLAEGADLLLVTGGMSVDPDDVTRQGIRQAGAVDFMYGAPVLPGAMFMMAAIEGVPVLGLPACGLYHETTVFDLVLPRILAGEQLTRRDLARLGHGGLCLHCPQCRYPRCAFGKG